MEVKGSPPRTTHIPLKSADHSPGTSSNERLIDLLKPLMDNDYGKEIVKPSGTLENLFSKLQERSDNKHTLPSTSDSVFCMYIKDGYGITQTDETITNYLIHLCMVEVHQRVNLVSTNYFPTFTVTELIELLDTFECLNPDNIGENTILRNRDAFINDINKARNHIMRCIISQWGPIYKIHEENNKSYDKPSNLLIQLAKNSINFLNDKLNEMSHQDLIKIILNSDNTGAKEEFFKSMAGITHTLTQQTLFDEFCEQREQSLLTESEINNFCDSLEKWVTKRSDTENTSDNKKVNVIHLDYVIQHLKDPNSTKIMKSDFIDVMQIRNIDTPNKA